MGELKYLQVFEQISAKIKNGELHTGNRLPSEAVLCERFGVSRQTLRQALKKLADDGYINSRQGSGSYVIYRSPVKEGSRRIAVITSYISDYIFPSILRGVEEIAADSGYSIIISATNNCLKTERQLIEGYLNDKISGYIIEGTKSALPNPNVDYYRYLAASGVPIVFINNYYPQLDHQNIRYVVVNDEAGGEQAVERLVGHGHYRIGGIFKSDDLQGIKRYSGFIDGIIKEHAELEDSHVVWYTTESSAALFDNFKDKFEPIYTECSAIVCYNDQMALRFVKELKKLEGKTSITEIYSFDSAFPPELFSGLIQNFHSLAHPKYDLGKLAATKLISLIRGGEEKSVSLPWGDNDSKAYEKQNFYNKELNNRR